MKRNWLKECGLYFVGLMGFCFAWRTLWDWQLAASTWEEAVVRMLCFAVVAAVSGRLIVESKR